MRSRLLAIATLLSGFWLLAGGAAQAADAAPEAEAEAEGPAPPKLSIAGPESVVFELDGASGTANLLVINAGGLDATVRATSIQVDDPTGDCTVRLSGDSSAVVAAHDDAMLPVAIRTHSCADESGTFIVESDPSSDPVAARFSFARSDSLLTYAFPPVLAALSAAILGFGLRSKSHQATIDLGPAFSFKDSWLTTVATFTAILGTILTTTGVVASLLPGLDINRLLTLNLAFGGLVLIAPVVYAALAKWEWRQDVKSGKHDLHPLATRRSLILASATTLAGVVGQLATIGILVDASTLDTVAQGVLALVLVSIAIVVFVYAWVWTAVALGRPLDGEPAQEEVVAVAEGQVVVTAVPVVIAPRPGSGTL